ncbi:hypothetical protein VMCG_10483 [Cytospora schulzeri]|uniref:Secreted protein n=1 Tax=Cytospora schulzeri TaxID=448051 RepID=A0A423VBQ2_9PEZI|nr:hypothetical protein VMCG_10483 [Valsa malicola]
MAWPSPLSCVLALAVFVSTMIRHVVAREYGFANPSNVYRPKFRYWLPDASASSDIVAKDISSMSTIGAGGLQFVPFYLYGLVYSQIGMGSAAPNSVAPPTDWSIYGFGDEAFNMLFKDVLQAVRDEGDGFVIDFALGPSQGAGVPSVPGTDGLAVQLVPGNAAVVAGKSFSGPVPPPYLPEIIQSGVNFQNTLEKFGTANFTAIFAMRVVGDTSKTGDGYGAGDSTLPLVVLDEDSYVDLTPLVSTDGQLEWTPPVSGLNSTWRIFSFWEQYTNQRECHGGLNATTVIGNGSWIVDHFSSTGAQKVTKFWDEQILTDQETAELLSSVGEYAWEDSLEMLAALYWTPDFLSRFEHEMGYNIIKYLPLLYNPTNAWYAGSTVYPELYQYGEYTLDNQSVHEPNYYAVLGSGYQDYIDHFEKWSHFRGVHYSNQPAYNLPLEMLRMIPSVDTPECESLGFDDSLSSYRQFSGPAHLSGRNVISSEMGAVSGPAYNLTIPQLLFHIKRSLAGGVTQHVLHGSPYSGNYPNTTWPGYTPFYYLFSEQWTPHLPTFGSGHLKDAVGWIGRNQWVLQQGKPKIDLAVYYYAAPWAPGGEDVFGGVDGLGALGYTYDYLGPENLLLPQAIVTEGLLAADGPAYKALVFSGQQVITNEAAQVVLAFAKAGLPIIVVGGKSSLPNETYPSTMAHTALLATTMAQLADSPSVHFLPSVSEVAGVLSQLSIKPRVGLNCTSNPVYPVLRSDVDKGVEYMWLYNDQDLVVNCTVSFTTSRHKSTTPFVYDAFTGKQEELVQYATHGDTFTLPVSLAANETTILAFKLGPSKSTGNKKSFVTSSSHNVASIRRSPSNSRSTSVLATITSSGSATLTFDSGKTVMFDVSLPMAADLTTWDITIEDWHAPDDLFDIEAGTVITLHNFTDHPLVPWTDLGAGFEKVSGVGRYTTQFTVPPLPSTNNASTCITQRIGALLSLGPVVNTVRVSIDGVQLPPIDPVRPVVDISSYLGKAGHEHELTVEVSTTLFNRVKSMADEIMMWGQIASVQQSLYASEGPFGYGLLGPVTVQWISVAEVDVGAL